MLFPEKKLGFGLMRLPLAADGTIDLGRVCAMVDAFLAGGFTYFDTAYGYHEGKSEPTIRKALVERHPRDSFTLATKLPAWFLKGPESVQQIFDEQLERTGAGYFDYYLLHAVDSDNVQTYDRYDCWNWALRMRAEGRIRHFGFSFHDTAAVLDELLTKHPEVDFVQLQLNYLDWDNELVQSAACYETATRHGVPVVVMEPVKGGTLASMPEDAAKILRDYVPDASLPSWAIRFCASLENVKMVLSGMSTEDQMADNVRTMSDFRPLTEEERDLLRQAADKLRDLAMVPCTACRYCEEGCPQGIHIPDLIRCLNHRKVYGKSGDLKERYQALVKEGAPASACVGCGQCEGVCPQHLPVPEILRETAEAFEG